jgi:hypothetical protein
MTPQVSTPSPLSGLSISTPTSPAELDALQRVAATPYVTRHPGAPVAAIRSRECGCEGVGEAVVPMPQTDYAAQMIHVLWHNHGIRSIAVSRNWRDRLVLEHRYPTLASQAIAASYVLGRRSIDDLAHTLKQRHNVVAVIPHHEETVVSMTALSNALGLPWAQPDVAPLFRDKAGLKAHIRRRDPSIRLTRSALVDSVDQVNELVRYWSLDRYVIKPNDGSGNSRVGFFRRRSPMQDIADHLLSIDGPAVLEEFVDGAEFYINGQIDHHGETQVTAVHQYQQVTVLGKPNIDAGAMSIAHIDPRYDILTDYARRVMQATGLQRSPFHMEVKLDHRGPSLIEVGARFVGMGAAMLDSLTSGIDVFDIAAHYYLHDFAYPALPTRTPRRPLHTATVLGVSDTQTEVSGFEGVTEAEQVPGFLAWTRSPARIGRFGPTTDLESTPWAALMVGADADSLRRSAIELRRTMSGNSSRAGVGKRAASLPKRLWQARPRAAMLRTRAIRRAPKAR